jgi:NhaP-type Na+/H+ or K+/H+ antiporter
MGLGGAVIVLGLLTVRTLQSVEVRRYGEGLSDPSGLIIGALGAGLLVGATFGWRRSRPLDNDWQSGVVAVLSAVGSLLIAFFLALPADHFFGAPGLVALGGAAAALGVVASRWAVRGGESLEQDRGAGGGG